MCRGRPEDPVSPGQRIARSRSTTARFSRTWHLAVGVEFLFRRRQPPAERSRRWPRTPRRIRCRLGDAHGDPQGPDRRSNRHARLYVFKAWRGVEDRRPSVGAHIVTRAVESPPQTHRAVASRDRPLGLARVAATPPRRRESLRGLRRRSAIPKPGAQTFSRLRSAGGLGGVGGRSIRRSDALLARWLTSLLSHLGLPKESDERAPSFEVALVEGSNEVFKPSDLRFHKRELRFIVGNRFSLEKLHESHGRANA